MRSIVRVMIGGIAVFSVLLGLAGCQEKMVPDALTGKWVSDDQRYEGCALEIETACIVFHDAEYKGNICPILSVSSKQKGSALAVTIGYTGPEDVASTTTFVWSPDNGGSLWLKNQPGVIWKRAATNVTLSNGTVPVAGQEGNVQ